MNASFQLRPENSGVFLAPYDLEELRRAAGHAHCRWFTVDLAGVRDKAGFLAACARDLAFPAHFGGNWDAFADSIGELAADDAHGAVIEFVHARDFARHAPSEAATALEILRDATGVWRNRECVFIVLFDEEPTQASLAEFVAPGA